MEEASSWTPFASFDKVRGWVASQKRQEPDPNKAGHLKKKDLVMTAVPSLCGTTVWQLGNWYMARLGNIEKKKCLSKRQETCHDTNIEKKREKTANYFRRSLIS